MKNQQIYDSYAIVGWPSPFYSVEAQDKYNNKVAGYCQALPLGAEDLTKWQSMRLGIYGKLIFFRDIFWAMKER